MQRSHGVATRPKYWGSSRVDEQSPRLWVMTTYWHSRIQHDNKLTEIKLPDRILTQHVLVTLTTNQNSLRLTNHAQCMTPTCWWNMLCTRHTNWALHFTLYFNALTLILWNVSVLLLGMYRIFDSYSLRCQIMVWIVYLYSAEQCHHNKYE